MELIVIFGLSWLLALTLGGMCLFLKVAKAQVLNDLVIKAYERANDCHIRIGAIEKSTHTIHPVPANSPANEEFEKQLAKLTGGAKEDFDTDLLRAGFNASDADDLV